MKIQSIEHGRLSDKASLILGYAAMLTTVPVVF
jgi:hypothetical protein